jgi:hypothetical protein
LEMFETIRQQLLSWFAERRRGDSDMIGPVVPRFTNLNYANVAQAIGIKFWVQVTLNMSASPSMVQMAVRLRDKQAPAVPSSS